MVYQLYAVIEHMDTSFSLEHTRLVRLCAAITSRPDIAEDLAQETLLEAWRHLPDLRDAARFQQWLSGIARNVCLRWMHQQGKEAPQRLEIHLQTGEPELEELLVDDYDLEVELERKELIELLDRSLALLPADTRTALIEHYVYSSPLAEVAERLGTNAAAIAMRLQRGKLALRRLLTQEMSTQDGQQQEEWEQTRVWCINCGQQKVMAHFQPEQAILQLQCPHCAFASDTQLTNSCEAHLFRGIKSHKPALSRLLNWVYRYYYEFRQGLSAPCLCCGTPLPLLTESIPPLLFPYKGPVFYNHCEHCHFHNLTSLSSIVLSLPEGQRFWKEHPRIHIPPQQEIEVDGHSAFLTTIESVTDAARLTVITTADTYQVLRIHGGLE